MCLMPLTMCCAVIATDRCLSAVSSCFLSVTSSSSPVVTEAEREILASSYASPYFFDSHALQQIDYETVVLDRVYRQNDMEFLGLLNAIRENRADTAVLARLNSRCDREFDPDDGEGFIRLTTHNYQAVRFNSERMEALRTQPVIYRAEVTGNFPESSYPVDHDLVLKGGRAGDVCQERYRDAAPLL